MTDSLDAPPSPQAVGHKALAWAASSVVAAVLLWFAARRQPLWPAAVVLPRPDLLWLAISLYVPYSCLRAFRIACVLDPLVARASDGSRSRLRRTVLYGTGFVSFFVVFLLPFRLGELSRPVLLAGAREPGVGLPESVSAIAIERVVDGLLVCAMLFVGLASADSIAADGVLADIRHFGRWMVLVFAVGLVLLLVAAGDPPRSRDWARIALRPFGEPVSLRLAGVVERFAAAIRMLADSRRAAAFIVCSLLYWSVTAWQLWAVLHACGLSLGMPAAVAIVAIVGLAIQLPGGPAQAGSFQFGAAVALGLFVAEGTGDAKSSFAALLYLLQLGGAVVMTVPGLVLLGVSRRGRA